MYVVIVKRNVSHDGAPNRWLPPAPRHGERWTWFDALGVSHRSISTVSKRMNRPTQQEALSGSSRKGL
jgi:hypothetical protein